MRSDCFAERKDSMSDVAGLASFAMLAWVSGAKEDLEGRLLPTPLGRLRDLSRDKELFGDTARDWTTIADFG